MEISYKDHLEYMRGMGEWTPAEKMQWEYLSAVVSLLSEISDKLSPNDDLTPNLKGQFRIQSGGMGKPSSAAGYSSFTD